MRCYAPQNTEYLAVRGLHRDDCPAMAALDAVVHHVIWRAVHSLILVPMTATASLTAAAFSEKKPTVTAARAQRKMTAAPDRDFHCHGVLPVPLVARLNSVVTV